MFHTSYHLTYSSSGKQMPHAVSYLPFLESWRLFLNCGARKLLRPLCGFGVLYTPVNNGEKKAKMVATASGDWAEVCQH
jgi:hypothetical protein